MIIYGDNLAGYFDLLIKVILYYLRSFHFNIRILIILICLRIYDFFYFVCTLKHLTCIHEISVIIFKPSFKNFEASRSAAARGVTVEPTGCGFDPYSRT